MLNGDKMFFLAYKIWGFLWYCLKKILLKGDKIISILFRLVNTIPLLDIFVNIFILFRLVKCFSCISITMEISSCLNYPLWGFIFIYFCTGIYTCG